MINGENNFSIDGEGEFRELKRVSQGLETKIVWWGVLDVNFPIRLALKWLSSPHKSHSYLRYGIGAHKQGCHLFIHEYVHALEQISLM